jgi:hypothetical protein
MVPLLAWAVVERLEARSERLPGGKRWSLGVVQGLTGAHEFFPVSSSGHLVMGGAVLGLEVPGILFEVAVHVATLISVLFVYRVRIWTLIRGCCGAGGGEHVAVRAEDRPGDDSGGGCRASR